MLDSVTRCGNHTLTAEQAGEVTMGTKLQNISGPRWNSTCACQHVQNDPVPGRTEYPGILYKCFCPDVIIGPTDRHSTFILLPTKHSKFDIIKFEPNGA